ncbi:hypothetical protein Y1Q_0011418 [Alligator mississippiensis]|uniref:Ig-like domain-containing protein n=1 Tax=Alligator mississippiensis TaxID=8496 RepID=A0A151PBG4_ALLMI|nr:hypothetical protein Y1Q_0011418 [Alligator mississippiensis]
MEGTFPKDVAVTWERIHSKDRTVPESAGDQESPEHQPLYPALQLGWRVTEERAGTRLTSSLTFTPTLQDHGAQVRCVFLHKAKRIREERVSPEIRVWAQPQVSEIQVLPERDPCDKALVPGQPETLRCLISGFYPGQLAVTWLRKGAGEKAPRPLESSDPHRMHTPAPTRAPDGKSYSVESELRLPPAGPEDDGVEYLCRVQHEALKEPESRSSGRLRVQGSTKARPRDPRCLAGEEMATVGGQTDAWALRLGGLLLPLLFLGTAGSQLQVTTAPSSTARVGSGALLQCRFDVGGLVALDFLRVTWYFWEQKLAWYELGRSQDQPGASLPSEKELESGDASLSLAVATVSDEGLYRCVVGYGTQQRQGNTTLHLLAAPTISIPRKPVVADAETSLLCHVGRFFPEDVDVVWMRDGQVLKGSTRSSPHRNTDGTFNLTLTYTFTPTHSDASSIFSCRVRHDALEQPIQQDVPLDIRGEFPCPLPKVVQSCRWC